jgi:hypothetical protein
VPLECGHDVRQKMDECGAMLCLRVDYFPVPHGANNVKLLSLEIDVLPFHSTWFGERQSEPSGDNDRAAPCKAAVIFSTSSRLYLWLFPLRLPNRYTIRTDMREATAELQSR